MGVGAEANSGDPTLRYVGGEWCYHCGHGNTPGLGPLMMPQAWHVSYDIPLSQVAAVLDVVKDIDDGVSAVSAIDAALTQCPAAATAWAVAKSKASASSTTSLASLYEATFRAWRRRLH